MRIELVNEINIKQKSDSNLSIAARPKLYSNVFVDDNGFYKFRIEGLFFINYFPNFNYIRHNIENLMLFINRP